MSKMSPERLLADVNKALAAETRVEIEDLSIEFNADEGVLSVHGRVDSIMAKRIAANVARRVAGKECLVADRLRVRAARSGELELRDAVARTLAAENLFRDHTLAVEAGGHRETIRAGAPGAGRIEASVDDSVVTLVGRVSSLGHRRFAEVLMWWTAGCERVDNLLEIAPPEQDSDNEITDVVRMALEKNPMVHASQLRVGTAAGIVELRGLVPSEEERQLAVLDAWYVPGVWDVVDRIEVRA